MSKITSNEAGNPGDEQPKKIFDEVRFVL